MLLEVRVNECLEKRHSLLASLLLEILKVVQLEIIKLYIGKFPNFLTILNFCK
ncbi:hypothetical protein GGD38_006974 [Chitinophagaceae bacterium OAS944]|nr:hypothetical protein [Chitinophagaceae bacterium OAS944]